MRLGFLLSILALSLCNCSTVVTQEMVTAELSLKQTKISAATVVAVSCQQGLMKESECIRAYQVYQLAQVSGNTALALMLVNCADENLRTQIQAAIIAGYPALSFSQIVNIPATGTSTTTDSVISTN